MPIGSAFLFSLSRNKIFKNIRNGGKSKKLVVESNITKREIRNSDGTHVEE